MRKKQLRCLIRRSHGICQGIYQKKKKSLPIRYEFRQVTVHVMIVFVFILVEKLKYDTKGRNVTYSNIRKIHRNEFNKRHVSPQTEKNNFVKGN